MSTNQKLSSGKAEMEKHQLAVGTYLELGGEPGARVTVHSCTLLGHSSSSAGPKVKPERQHRQRIPPV